MPANGVPGPRSSSGLSRRLDRLRAGDALVVRKLDRIGRSLGHVVELAAGRQAKGIGLEVLTRGIDTNQLHGPPDARHRLARIGAGGPVPSSC
jgi:DNA invertase Pin-like site-specific DNA recombinase